MATLTLARAWPMAASTITSGGGFLPLLGRRYWQIPHFEKMLYDNGALLALYSQAYLATGEQRFGDIANETADWMLDDMVDANGGFYSTRDADSEGEEGKFYVWTPEQAESLIDDRAWPLFADRFGLNKPANFEGHWHLTVRHSINDIAKDHGIKTAEATALRSTRRGALCSPNAPIACRRAGTRNS